jgi:ribonuclease G
LVKIIVNYATSEKRYVFVENKKITKLFVDQPIQHSLVGNIYLGIVTKVLPGMNAAFIDIGEEKQGFLHRDKLASFFQASKDDQQKPISAFVHQGERIVVQVEKDPAGTKGPRLTGVPELQGENIIYMPHGGFVATSQKIESSLKRDELKAFGESLVEQQEGIIFRTNSAKANTAEIEEELIVLRQKYKLLLKDAISGKGPQLLETKDLFLAQLSDDLNTVLEGEIWVDEMNLKQRLATILSQKRLEEKISLHFYQEKENIFSAMAVGNEIEKALKRIVWLETGAYMVMDEAEALTIIDVNTGKFVGKSSRDVTVHQVNLDAAKEVARQIILRDLGGIILIDFIDMKLEKERQSIINALAIELKKDAKKPKIIGFTDLGILQLTRRKTKPTLSETLLMKCPTCDGSGKVFSTESVAFRLERELWEYRHSDFETISVTTTEGVLRFFSGDQVHHLQKLEETIGLKIQFTCVEASKPFYEITKFSSL